MKKTFGVIGGDRRQAELSRLLAGLETKYGYDRLNAMLVLKDILAKIWNTEC